MYSLNNKFFESIDCELKAYWLGFLFADGCVLESFNKYTGALKAMRLQLSLAEKDIEHVKNFKHDIESGAPISKNIIHLDSKIYNSAKITICNTKMCRDLISLNCVPRKSLILEYPTDKIPSEFECDFIRGYFDGDGAISLSYYNNSPNLYSNILGTDNMCDNIIKILSKNDIISYKHHYKNSVPEIRVSGRQNIYNYYNFMYRSGNAIRYLQRKYDKFQQIFHELNIGV